MVNRGKWPEDTTVGIRFPLENRLQCSSVTAGWYTSGVDIIVTTLPGWGWGGGVEPGGSDDRMTITIAPSVLLSNCWQNCRISQTGKS